MSKKENKKWIDAVEAKYQIAFEKGLFPSDVPYSIEEKKSLLRDFQECKPKTVIGIHGNTPVVFGTGGQIEHNSLDRFFYEPENYSLEYGAYTNAKDHLPFYYAFEYSYLLDTHVDSEDIASRMRKHFEEQRKMFLKIREEWRNRRTQ